MIQNVEKNKYKITIDCGFINGRRKRLSRTIIGTHTDAKLKEAELILQVKNNKNIQNKKLTFSKLADMFIEDYCRNSVKENTMYNYKNLLKMIIKELGSYEVEMITSYILQKFYNKLQNEFEYSPNSLQHYYVLINNIFERGIKWQLITNNPNKFIDKPKLEKKEAKIYDYEQLSKLFECLNYEPITYQAPIILCVDTGMRREELNGLKWEDINLVTGEIFIKRVRIAVGKEVIITTPKTIKSKRNLFISKTSLNVLKKLKEYQNNLTNTFGSKWNDTGYVFVNDTGIPYYPDTLSKIFKKILKKYNLDDLTFHQLRHTSASLLINNNEDIASVSTRIGHANISTTLNMYTHILEKSKKNTANTMNKILNNL